MVAHTLILYHSTDGHTIKICNRLKEILREQDFSVHLTDVESFSRELEAYELIVIAASIRYGHHHELVHRFIESNEQVLNDKTSVFISVNLVARKPEKSTPETNPYVIKFLKEINWVPSKVFVFAGNLDYPKYSFGDRMMIQLIMLITGGPTNSRTHIEFTDWKKVDACGYELCHLSPVPAHEV